MAIIKALKGIVPKIDESCYLAETAVVTGDVEIGAECSVWFGGILRGDAGPIRVGHHTNVQDNSVLHASFQNSVVEIGNYVTIGHQATVHGAKVEDFVLVGMNSVILDNSIIGEGAVVAAGAVIKEGTIVEPYTLWAGVPAKCVKKLDSKATKEIREKMAIHYGDYVKWHIEG